MIDRVNVLANAVMTIGSGAFYLMLFSPAVKAFNAEAQFGRVSYWVVRVGLSFFAAGSLLATLTMPEVSWSQFIRNVGTAILFAWAAGYHAKKWGVLTTRKRQTGSIPVVK